MGLLCLGQEPRYHTNQSTLSVLCSSEQNYVTYSYLQGASRARGPRQPRHVSDVGPSQLSAEIPQNIPLCVFFTRRDVFFIHIIRIYRLQ